MGPAGEHVTVPIASANLMSDTKSAASDPLSEHMASANLASEKPAGIDLSRYPIDGQGRVLRFFQDRPVLRQLGAVFASGAAQLVALAAMEGVRSHFETALDRAHGEFVSQFPGTELLLRDAGLEQLRQNYQAALAEFSYPKNARAFGQIWTAALTPSHRVEAALHEVDERLTTLRVQPQDVQALIEAGQAYEEAMCDLQDRISQYLEPLPAMAEDLGQRAAGLQNTGKEAERKFWTLIQSAVGIGATMAGVDNPIWHLYSVGRTLESLGDRMNSLSQQVSSRATEYQRTFDQLHEQLTELGGQLNTLQTTKPR
jgi:hypothetical protein